MEEITRFDECMFTVGAQIRQRFLYRTERGRLRKLPTLAYDMRGLDAPDLHLLAFPGEEPPQIECNEDAAGEFADE